MTKGNHNARQRQDENKTSFLYIRCYVEDKSKWVRAANASKGKLTDWVVKTLNAAASAEDSHAPPDTRL